MKLDELNSLEIPKIEWKGPFVYANTEECLFYQKDAEGKGVYLWTIEHENGYLVNYVGMSADSISGRFQEHLACFLGGKYTIYETGAFIKGDTSKVLYRPEGKINSFLNDFAILSNKVISQINSYRLFYANLDESREWLERVESGIISTLREAEIKEGIPKFLDNYKVSRSIPARDKVEILMKGTQEIIGLDVSIYA